MDRDCRYGLNVILLDRGLLVVSSLCSSLSLAAAYKLCTGYAVVTHWSVQPCRPTMSRLRIKWYSAAATRQSDRLQLLLRVLGQYAGS